MDKFDEPLEVFAGTAWEAALVKTLLENAEIEAFLKDEIRGTMIPWHISDRVDTVKVVISESDYEKARMVVRDFEFNRKSGNSYKNN